MLTQERLKELLSYDPETGLFTWLVNRGSVKAGKVVTCKMNCGYIEVRIDKKNYLCHRLAWLYMTGEWPREVIDHENRRRDDNRWSNLREATHSQNGANSKHYSSNTLGIRGVSIKKGAVSKPFHAYIRINGRGQHIGCFASKSEASAAYENAAKQHFGEFAA